MNRPRLLDLFCGAGGAAMGYHRAGFEVVGVDIEPQPDYPFEFVQGDAIMAARHFGRDFDAIHASPPCQRFTTLKTVWNYKGDAAHPDLVAETRCLLVASERPWVIENVPGAPLCNPGLLCGSMFNLGVEVGGEWRQLRRHRLFETSFAQPALIPYCRHFGPTIGIYGDHARDRRRKPGVRDRGVDFPDRDKLELGRQAMGMDWVAHWTGLSQAVPPAYTQWLGGVLIRLI